MNIFCKILFLVWPLIVAPRVPAQTLRVAAAADAQYAMNDLAGRFERQTGTKVALTYGSSGNLRAQIQNGAPFDLFFSADLFYAQQLISAGVADTQSLTVYAQGRLVLWAPAGAQLHLAERGFAALKDPRIQRVAIANPQHAPYGRAAIAALQETGLYGQIRPKLVFGENIAQAAQFVQSGNAQVGIIALSLTFAESMRGGERWEVPANLYMPLQQAAVMVNSSSNKAAAKAFLEFVKSAEGRNVLSNYGLMPGVARHKL